MICDVIFVTIFGPGLGYRWPMATFYDFVLARHKTDYALIIKICSTKKIQLCDILTILSLETKLHAPFFDEL